MHVYAAGAGPHTLPWLVAQRLVEKCDFVFSLLDSSKIRTLIARHDEWVRHATCGGCNGVAASQCRTSMLL